MPSDYLTRTKDLLRRYGWNTTCYQIVNPGIRRWFGGEVVAGYVCKAGTTVVAGAPVGPDLAAAVEAFERGARNHVCYFGAEERMRELTEGDARYSTAVLGAQPVWEPGSFLAKFEADASLRAQRSRARNKRVAVAEWPPERAEQNPRLHRVLEEWLATRGMPPMHFLVEPETLGMLEGRRVFVASIEDEPVGFLVLSPIPARRGWLTEQFVRGRKAPNGTVELMMWEAVRAIADDGDRFVTMGIVPLSTKAVDPSVRNPVWLEALVRWARAHGRRFYNFEGLEWFKDKFHPDEWQPIYVISKERSFSVRSLYAVAAAFTDEPPLVALLRGLGRALRQEVVRMRDLRAAPREIQSAKSFAHSQRR